MPFGSRIINKIAVVLALLAIAGISGCSKWLDVPPRDKVPESELFTTEQGFIDALNGVYLNMDKASSSGLSDGFYSNAMTLGLVSVLGYDYDVAGSSSVPNANLYNPAYVYEYTNPTLQSEILDIWKAFYVNISNLNNIIKQVDDRRNVFFEDNFERVKGEAIALRAFHHFDVIRLWGLPPGTAGATPGIPYVTNFGILATPLSSVNEALEFCLTDLRIASALLAKTDTSTLVSGNSNLFKAYTQNHLNHWAVKGLMARVFLYQGKTDSAAYYAAQVIGSGKFPLITRDVASSANSMRDRTYYQELLFALYAKTLRTNVQVIFTPGTGIPLYLTNAGLNRVYATPAADAADWRLASWFDRPGNYTVPSKLFQDANLKYEWQNVVPLIRVSEMYYIAAECAGRIGDVVNGVGYLNQVRRARGLGPISTNITTDSLGNALTREYKKEFITEGQTFFYYKRLGLDFKAASGYPLASPPGMYTFPLPDIEKEYR
jgi:hypothetical protein